MRLKFYVNSRRLTGFRERGGQETAARAQRCHDENSEERCVWGHRFRVLRRALDDGYFGQPDNKAVETKENDFISGACVCRILSGSGRYSIAQSSSAMSLWSGTVLHAKTPVHVAVIVTHRAAVT